MTANKPIMIVEKQWMGVHESTRQAILDAVRHQCFESAERGHEYADPGRIGIDDRNPLIRDLSKAL